MLVVRMFIATGYRFISHQCFLSYSLTDVLREAQVGSKPPVIIMRDFPHFHTLNSAGVFFRGSEAARLFLSLLTSRMHWIGTLDFDQSAFDQSIIEFLDLWINVMRGTSDLTLSGGCGLLQIPWFDYSPTLEQRRAATVKSSPCRFLQVHEMLAWLRALAVVQGHLGGFGHRHKMPEV
eukprot:Skav201092  [mRNA]  locus=scaffold2562:107064:116388:+ [translate_table: standard]